MLLVTHTHTVAYDGKYEMDKNHSFYTGDTVDKLLFVERLKHQVLFFMEMSYTKLDKDSQHCS